MFQLSSKLSSHQKRFLAETVGTFIVVVCAAGSVVLDARMNGVLGISFIAFAPFAGVAAGVYLFGKISMAHFNPAVSLGFLITRHITKFQFLYYITAEIVGALLAGVFVKFIIGSEANLGANALNYEFPVALIIGVEVLATALLMGVIFAVVHTKGLRGLGGIAIGGIVGLDIYFLSFISGASMNPARSLAPALLSGIINDLWLYWTATFLGSGIAAVVYRMRRKQLSN